MGAWGVGITQDDTVLDLIEDFKDSLKKTKNLEITTKLIIDENKDLINDEDEGPLFWIAIAKCQWEYGNLEPNILKQVIEDFEKENGLERWKEESNKDYIARKKVLLNFIEKIKQVNTKPKKFPKLIIRKPIFSEGDCLSVKVNENFYGAAIVIRSDESNPEYGENLVVATTYWGTIPPKQEDFSEIEWLRLTYANWNGGVHKAWYSPVGFRKHKDLIAIVCNIDVSKFNEISCKSYSSWSNLGNLIGRQMANS